MDHSYSTEREKVQKTDHSYFTVAKKTPKVVLRKAQLMKEQQESNRTAIGQDHSYVRPDHVIQLTELTDNDTVCARNDENLGYCIPRLLQTDAQALFNRIDNRKLHEVFGSSEMHQLSGVSSLALARRPPIANICFEDTRLAGCDLDNIDTQISGIRLDHAYDLKSNIDAHRRSIPSSIRSKMADQSNAVPCRDQLLSLRLHDHTYLRTKIVDNA